MSAISAEPMTVVASQPDVYTPTRTYPRHEPVYVPDVRSRERVRPQAPKSQGRSKSKAKGLQGVVLLQRATLFVSVAALTCAASTLAGQVMVERAHQEAVHARQRAVIAEKSVSILRDQVNRLTSDKMVIGWAEAHDMVVPKLVAEEKVQGVSGAQGPG